MGWKLKQRLPISLYFFLGLILSLLLLSQPMTKPNQSHQSIRIEAEDYSSYYDSSSLNYGKAYRQDSVDIEATTDLGGGYNVGWIEEGEWLTYDLEIPVDGTYQIVARTASQINSNHSLSISLDGQQIDYLDFKGTGAWQTWQDVMGEEIKLTAGKHQLRLDMHSSLFNLNYLTLVPVSTINEQTPPTASRETPVNKPIPEVATYYLAPYGNDSNDGSLENPFFSLEKVSSVAKPGDVIYLRGGEYNYTKPQWLAAQGTADARITFMSAPGETAILDGSYVSDDISVKDIIGITGKYLDFKNLEVRDSKRHGISSWGASHIRLIDNHLHHNQHSGAWFGYQDMTTTTDIVFDGNLVEYNDLVSQYHAPAGHPGALVTMGASNSTFVNNIVRNNYGEGIISVLTKGAYIANNQISDNLSVNLYLDNASDVVAEKNLIYNTGDTRFHTGGRAASGIQVANEKYDFWFHLSNQEGGFKIVNNIIADNGYGFFYGNYDRGGGLRDSLIANNTFYHADNSLLYISSDAGHQNTTFANNIFVQESGKPLLDFGGSSGINWSNNGWSGGNPGAASSSSDVMTDSPLLLNPSIDKISGFGLQSDSPFIGKGVTNFGVEDDYFGTSRNDSIDLGAIQSS